MPSDRDVGEFLLRELLTTEPYFHRSPFTWDCVVSEWEWSGQIIERMRRRGYVLYVAECDKYLSFEKPIGDIVKHGDEWSVEGILEPRTIALAAAKALGMEEKGGKRE